MGACLKPCCLRPASKVHTVGWRVNNVISRSYTIDVPTPFILAQSGCQDRIACQDRRASTSLIHAELLRRRTCLKIRPRSVLSTISACKDASDGKSELNKPGMLQVSTNGKQHMSVTFEDSHVCVSETNDPSSEACWRLERSCIHHIARGT